jgi:hypothetical protein
MDRDDRGEDSAQETHQGSYRIWRRRYILTLAREPDQKTEDQSNDQHDSPAKHSVFPLIHL